MKYVSPGLILAVEYYNYFCFQCSFKQLYLSIRRAVILKLSLSTILLLFKNLLSFLITYVGFCCRQLSYVQTLIGASIVGYSKQEYLNY